MANIEIQGINCYYRDQLPDEEVLFSQYEQEDQYFRRTSHPFSDDDIVAIANREHQYTTKQQSWKEEEEWRLDRGVYCKINELLTYIPGSYYGYVNYWTLENGKTPEYREADRLFFIFMEYLYFQTAVLGVTRGKGRRQGATSMGAYWLWWICGRRENSNGGIISYNDTAGSEVFSKMFLRGIREMLPCFVADIDSNSETSIRFRKKEDKKRKNAPTKKEGLNSFVDCRSTSINSYDSGRLSFFLCDESGKFPKMNINSYWSKAYPTLKEGRRKVGFAYLPTTVNPKKEGGANYKIFWKDANQNAINPATGEKYGLNTPHKVVRYFVPATEGYAGCIDKFGFSVINDPGEPIMGNDGELIYEGAKTIIMNERNAKKAVSEERHMEHRRDFPLDEHDMFAFESGTCEFIEENIRTQQEYLENNPGVHYIRQCRLYPKQTAITDVFKRIIGVRDDIDYMDDNKGCWWLYEEPKIKNNYRQIGQHFEGLNTTEYVIGVDTFGQGFANNGSKGTICVFKKSCIENGKETGLYPVAFYVGRPRLVQHFYDEVLKACMWYGCKANVEIDRGDFYYDYFAERKCVRFLEWTPAVDPMKKHPLLKPGTESADPFQLAAQLEACKKFIDGVSPDHYSGHVHKVYFPMLLEQLIDYDHSERTPYDTVIALMMALLPALKQTAPPRPPMGKPLVKLYTLKMTG